MCVRVRIYITFIFTIVLDKIQIKWLSAAKQDQMGDGSSLHRKHKSDT